MRIIMRWLPAVIWMAVIFYFSHQPADDLDTILPLFQSFFPQIESLDWGHFVAYFILALTIYWGLGGSYANWKGKCLTVLLCLIYGLTDEFHQQFVAGRHPDLIDLRNDVIGAILAMLWMSIPYIHRRYVKWRRSRTY